MVPDQAYDAFRRGYVEAILWANALNESTGEFEDLTYWFEGPGRWWQDTPVDVSDADEFLREHFDTLLTLSDDMCQHGHDFALTRNRHGAGFWDRGYGPVGDELSESAHAYGEHTVYVSED